MLTGTDKAVILGLFNSTWAICRPQCRGRPPASRSREDVGGIINVAAAQQN